MKKPYVLPRLAIVFLWATVSLFIAESIGPLHIGSASRGIVLLPMIWALLIGICICMVSFYWPALGMSASTQQVATAVLEASLLIYVAKLGLLVGGSLVQIVHHGPALLFQELGHFVGTILLALPLALLLGLKREAIGATFSVGREPSIAIIADRYGISSPEGRGVLAEYLTGTIFGAVFIALLAGFVTSLHVFRPEALAMGSGIGSGSMMSAAAGAVAAQQTPAVAKMVIALAAASNLITTTLGTYFTLFLSLPMAEYGYKYLEPILGRRIQTPNDGDDTESLPSMVPIKTPVKLGFSSKLVIWVATGFLVAVCDYMAHGTPLHQTLSGAGILLGVVIAGEILGLLTKKIIPTLCWVSLLGMLAASPISHYGAVLGAVSGRNDFLSIAAVMLSFAGLSVAKDLSAFRKLGWRIVLVSFVANAGTFLGASLVAQWL